MRRVHLLILTLIVIVLATIGGCRKKDGDVNPDPTPTPTPTPTPLELSDSTFTFGVWLQGANDIFNGITVAQSYKNIGINTFVGLYLWPTENWAYKGYTLATAKALKDAGMKAYAGDNKDAVDWIKAHPEYNETIIGYMLGDEPDMNRNSGNLVAAAANTPLAWKAKGDALKALDNTRPIYANFGKPFAKDAWYGNENGSTGSKVSDFNYYVAPTTVLSCDFYGVTDPWEPTNNHGVWTYGRGVRNTMKYAESRPVWGYLEASAPGNDATSSNWMFQRMPTNLVMPIVWNMVINGAQGIVYFCHDFSPGAGNLGKYAALREPGMAEAMRVANSSVIAYGAVLKSATITGTTTVTNGQVGVISLTKKFDGATYIFAMGDGNAANRDGQSVDAEITISGKTGNQTISVLNESRTLNMTNGTLKDHFNPYELHIYKIE